MVKFAHIADCHLGSWRQEEIQKLNFDSFEKIISNCLKEQVDFILIAGDLFDSAYPPIEILKKSFKLFKKIHDAKIPVYLIAGSHDFSASGKTFLDVLEKAGFCKNVEDWDLQEDGRIKLKPTMHGKIAIYGYPGRKSGMEVEDLKKVYFDSVHPFTIFMVHTTIRDVIGTIPIESIEKEKLPLADYYALGHIHKRFKAEHSASTYAYPGPTYPCNFQELADLHCGSYNLVEINGSRIKTDNIKVPLKEVVLINVELDNGLTATQEIISEIDKSNLRDKIVLLRLEGILSQGKSADIRFDEIEEFVSKKGASVFLKNISSLRIGEQELNTLLQQDENVENIEKIILRDYSKNNPANFNKYLHQMMNILSIEKNEDERTSIFEDRIISELKDALEISEVL